MHQLTSPSATYMRQGRGSRWLKNGLLLVRREAIIGTNAGLLSIGPFETNCSEIVI